MTTAPTNDQVSAVVEVLTTLAQVIKVHRPIPSGELYARVMGSMSIHTYQACIDRLVSLDVVSLKNHQLTWISPSTAEGVTSMSKKNRAQNSNTSSDHSARARGKKTSGSGQGSTQDQNAAPSSSAVATADAGQESILPEGQNIALSSGDSGLSSSGASVNTQTLKENGRMATLKFRKTDKSGSSSYSIEGVKSSVYFNKGMFAGEPPASIEIILPEGATFTQPGSTKVAGVAALTPEQRKANAEQLKAKRAAMTPAEKAAERLEKARAAVAAAEKAAKALEAGQTASA